MDAKSLCGRHPGPGCLRRVRDKRHLKIGSSGSQAGRWTQISCFRPGLAVERLRLKMRLNSALRRTDLFCALKRHGRREPGESKQPGHEPILESPSLDIFLVPPATCISPFCVISIISC